MSLYKHTPPSPPKCHPASGWLISFCSLLFPFKIQHNHFSACQSLSFQNKLNLPSSSTCVCVYTLSTHPRDPSLLTSTFIFTFISKRIYFSSVCVLPLFFAFDSLAHPPHSELSYSRTHTHTHSSHHV